MCQAYVSKMDFVAKMHLCCRSKAGSFYTEKICLFLFFTVPWRVCPQPGDKFRQHLLCLKPTEEPFGDGEDVQRLVSEVRVLVSEVIGTHLLRQSPIAYLGTGGKTCCLCGLPAGFPFTVGAAAQSTSQLTFLILSSHSEPGWTGVVGEAPATDQVPSALEERDLYMWVQRIAQLGNNIVGGSWSLGMIGSNRMGC